MRLNSPLPSRCSSARLLLGLAALAAACAPPDAAPGPDSVAVASVRVDSSAAAATVAATALRDSAQATLATLLKNPATAVFDSVLVIQPPAVGDRLPPMAVCGRILGRPGIGGRATPTRFVYRTKWAVFVEEPANREAFADLVARTCGAPGARVVLQ